MGWFLFSLHFSLHCPYGPSAVALPFAILFLVVLLFLPMGNPSGGST